MKRADTGVKEPLNPVFFIQNVPSLRSVVQMRSVSRLCRQVADERLQACVAVPMGEGTRARSFLEMMQSGKFVPRPWTMVAYYQFDPALVVERCSFERLHQSGCQLGPSGDGWKNFNICSNGILLAVNALFDGRSEAFDMFGFYHMDAYTKIEVPLSIDACEDDVVGSAAAFASRLMELRMMDVYHHLLAIDYPIVGYIVAKLLFKSFVDDLESIGPTSDITSNITFFIDYTPIVYIEKMFDENPRWITALLVEIARDAFVLMIRRGRINEEVFERLEMFIDIGSKM